MSQDITRRIVREEGNPSIGQHAHHRRRESSIEIRQPCSWSNSSHSFGRYSKDGWTGDRAKGWRSFIVDPLADCGQGGAGVAFCFEG
jgi:hypothetical protein